MTPSRLGGSENRGKPERAGTAASQRDSGGRSPQDRTWFPEASDVDYALPFHTSWSTPSPLVHTRSCVSSCGLGTRPQNNRHGPDRRERCASRRLDSGPSPCRSLPGTRRPRILPRPPRHLRGRAGICLDRGNERAPLRMSSGASGISPSRHRRPRRSQAPRPGARAASPLDICTTERQHPRLRSPGQRENVLDWLPHRAGHCLWAVRAGPRPQRRPRA